MQQQPELIARVQIGRHPEAAKAAKVAKVAKVAKGVRVVAIAEPLFAPSIVPITL